VGSSPGRKSLLVALLIVGAVSSSPAISVGRPARVSVGSSSEQANAQSDTAAISADGRYVAFCSDASNLVAGDTNGSTDVFVRDRVDRTTQLVSVSSTGEQGNDYSCGPSISADGQRISFDSFASNLVPDDTNLAYDAFVHDLTDGSTTRVSVSSTGEEGNLGEGSVRSSISGDGQVVSFESGANNLVEGDTNGEPDIFVHEMSSGITSRVSVGSHGEQSNGETSSSSMSFDGRFVAFESNDYAMVPGEDSFDWDIFLRDRTDGTTSRISDSPLGGEANDESFDPTISSDGQLVAFESFASNLVAGDTNSAEDVFLYDDTTGSIDRISVSDRELQGNDWSSDPAMSSDGRYVAFGSYASNLVPRDTNSCPDGIRGHCPDVFLRDRLAGRTVRVSIPAPGRQANDTSALPALTPDARFLAFQSNATNLVPGDTNAVSDVFLVSLTLPS